MSTKNCYTFNKKNGISQGFVGLNKSSAQYSNLNLNRDSCSPQIDSVHSKIISTKTDRINKEHSVFNNSSKSRTTLNNNKRSSKSDLCSFERLNLVDSDSEKHQKRWMKTESSSKNSSTLSLHIAAYENSIEALSTPQSQIEHFQHDPFEYPRQQENNQASKPEIMQFKASQKLLDNKKSNKKGQAPVADGKENMPASERTFIAIKPDGVQRGLVSKIIKRFEIRGYKLVGIKMCQPSQEHLECHYQDLKEKPFFGGLIEYMKSGPIVAMVWEGLDVVKQGRVMLGATNPLQSAPGSIRGDFCIQTGRNICHGSDSVESANREIEHWFTTDELAKYTHNAQNLIYE